MTSVDDKTLMLARADVAELFGACGAWRVWRGEAAETVCEAREHGATYTSDAWEHVSHPMKPILFQKCRLEKDEYDGGGGNKIGAALVAREAHGKFGRNFDWRVAVCGWSDEDVPSGVV